MSLFYGLCAGFVVCLPSWLVLRYLSAEAGMLVGLFLVTLLLVMTIYANSDEHTARYSSLSLWALIVLWDVQEDTHKIRGRLG